MSPQMSRALAGALAATAALWLTPSAFAHAQLESASPGVGSTVSSPSQIRLEFSEGVEPKFTGLTLTGPGGAARVGAASTEAGHQNVLIVPVAKSLSPGVYTVKWHAVSVDTHHTQGTFEFTVK
jgi:copper resistance protein C